MVNIVLWIIGAALCLLVALAVFIRMSSDDPDRWHVDPTTIQPSGKQNEFLILPDDANVPDEVEMARVYPVAAGALAAHFDTIAMESPRTRRIAGSPNALWMTYVQRSRVMGFPDYISVRVLDRGEAQSTLAIFSRSRFGTSDLGVNERRVRDWLDALSARAGGGSGQAG